MIERKVSIKRKKKKSLKYIISKVKKKLDNGLTLLDQFKQFAYNTNFIYPESQFYETKLFQSNILVQLYRIFIQLPIFAKQSQYSSTVAVMRFGRNR